VSRALEALAAGAFFALASPPFDLYAALWVGMAGLAWVLGENESLGSSPDRWPRARRELAGAGRGLAFGVGANVVALRFVPDVVARFTPLPWAAGTLALVLLSCEQGIRWAAAGLVYRQLARRGVPGWLAFAAGVYGGTFVPSVFPWTAAGGVTPVPEMVQLADLLGERGVTFVMALSAGLLASALRAVRARDLRRGLVFLSVALVIPLGTYLEGRARIDEVEHTRSEAKTAKIGLVQPSTEALERWDPHEAQAILDRLTRLTAFAEDQGVELTVWPEAAYPFELPHGSLRCPSGARAVLPVGVHGPVLTGIVLFGSGGDIFNSAAICRSDGSMSDPADKVHLLWFGETIPVIDRIPWIRRTFSRGTGMVPGTNPVLQSVGSIRAGVLNCFEDVLPAAGRSAMEELPNLLVNVTNDAWFAGSGESELHLRLSALRAVESRRDLVRAVNLGPTTWVDAAGVVRGRREGAPAGVLVVTPALLDGGPTMFDRFGDVPSLLLVLVAALAGAANDKRRRAPPRKATPRPARE
jgi:apolipoprotein N-acyltransferase